MSAEVSKAVGELPIASTYRAGARVTLRRAVARLTTPSQASFFRGLTARWASPNPATQRPMIASPTGCTTTMAQQTNAKTAR
jgi:hypothetical protein